MAQSLLLVIVLSAVIIVPSFAQVFNCQCSCVPRPLMTTDSANRSMCASAEKSPDFNATAQISPMCNFNQLSPCPLPNDYHETCPGWQCCKHRGRSAMCRAFAENFHEGNCTSDHNIKCYYVFCKCQHNSVVWSFNPTTRNNIKVTEHTTAPASSGSTINRTQKQTSKKRSIGTSLGIGLGIGFLILIAVIIALMAYCRKQGIKEGRKQTTVPSKHNVEIDRENSLSDYAEIGGNLYLGQQTVAGTTNPGYETVPKDTIIQGTTNSEYTDLSKPDISTKSHYQSLQKHSNDFESPDYIDPEKYTEPPHLKMSDEHEDVDDYVRQSTPSATGKNDEDHLNSPQMCDDYVEASLTDTNQHAHNKGHFGPKHDNIRETNSDYVNVDDQNLSKSQKPSGSKDASDYVDVDDQNLLKSQMPSGSNDASDYVDVDDPGLETNSKPIEANAGSDYVDVDDPNLTKGISKAEPDSDYVKV